MGRRAHDASVPCHVHAENATHHNPQPSRDANPFSQELEARRTTYEPRSAVQEDAWRRQGRAVVVVRRFYDSGWECALLLLLEAQWTLRYRGIAVVGDACTTPSLDKAYIGVWHIKWHGAFLSNWIHTTWLLG